MVIIQVFRPATFELKWGLSLIDFKPTLTTANQVKSVTVNGWDRETKQPIRGTASVENLKVNGDLRENFESCDAREERVEDEPVFTLDEANKKAMDLLKERSRDLVKASGTCIGLPGAACRSARGHWQPGKPLQWPVFHY